MITLSNRGNFILFFYIFILMLKPGYNVGAKKNPDWTLDASKALRVISDEKNEILLTQIDEINQKEIWLEEAKRNSAIANEDQQKEVQDLKEQYLNKTINLNDWVNPETSESRISGAAQLVMEMLDNDENYRNIAWLRFSDNHAFWLYTHWNNTLPRGLFRNIVNLQGKENAYKELLWLIQKETKIIFIENDKSGYTKSSEEFRITKVKKGMEELNQHRNDSEFNKQYNDWMYNVLYLLHESFWEAYSKKYWEYYRTEEQKQEIEAMKERSKNTKVA